MRPMRLLVVLFAFTAVDAVAGDPAPVPVLNAMPLCGLQRVGSVTSSDGREPVGNAREVSMASADYARALNGLARAGQSRGADAVVLTDHNAVFYTRGNAASKRPVYIHLDGVAVHFTDAARCTLQVQTADELLQRAIRNRGPATKLDATATN